MQWELIKGFQAGGDVIACVKTAQTCEWLMDQKGWGKEMRHLSRRTQVEDNGGLVERRGGEHGVGAVEDL